MVLFRRSCFHLRGTTLAARQGQIEEGIADLESDWRTVRIPKLQGLRNFMVEGP